MCEICSKLTIKTPEQYHRHRIEHISYIFLLLLLLTWSKQMFSVFKQKVLNPFVPNARFLYPLKTSEKRKVF